MTPLEEKITQLTLQWYTLIGPEHHKDRDCHWKITTLWSYGNPPAYLVEHHGYIRDHLEIRCNSYEDALRTLKRELETAISEEKEFQSLEVQQAHAALQTKIVDEGGKP